MVILHTKYNNTILYIHTLFKAILKALQKKNKIILMNVFIYF